MSDRQYIEIPGSDVHELPPLLVSPLPDMETGHDLVDLAAGMVEAEAMIPQTAFDDRARLDFEQRKYDLAVSLAEQYRVLVSHWQWGDSVLEWIRQCEITFESSEALRRLLHPDVWPHAGRSSFVELLVEKDVPTHGVGLEKAVGLRLTFRQPPPIDCFSDQFLFLLNASVANTAYRTWSHFGPEASPLLPPNRFHFQIHELN
jgi:hypothetical protein